MKIKTFALGLMLMFFAGITTSSVASVINLENGVVITKVDDDKDKDKKKSKTKEGDVKSCKDKKSCCNKGLKDSCKEKKADPEKK